jgi:hypothetical protein
MNDPWIRVAENLADRVSGPLKFRFVLQPVMASIFAVLSGLKDAKAGKPPYFCGTAATRNAHDDLLRGGKPSRF